MKKSSPGCPAFGLSHILQGYPPEQPTPVRLRYVPNSPFSFLQTSPLQMTLAYGFVFPPAEKSLCSMTRRCISSI
jgi:hypothetical protein